jgi:hypothetical protein
MSKSKAYKEKREKYISARRAYAKEQIEALGYHVEEEDKYTLSFMYRCHKVRFSPYTGAIVGHGIEQGLRGLKTLLEILKTK